MDTTLASVMKNIAEALQLDYNNKLEDAYVKYSECVHQIMSTLLKDINCKDGKVTITKEVMKYVQLGSQCMERIQIVVNTLYKSAILPSQKPSPVITTSPTASDSNSKRPSSPGCRFSAPVPPIPDPTDSRAMYQRTKSLGPLEIAYKRNELLMAAYKARQAKLNARNAFDLSLTLQRKMAENLAIAKLQEEALSKKMQERQHRLEELANQKFGSSDKQNKEIYKQVLNYEQDTSWLRNIREELEKNPTDQAVISKVMNAVLSCKDHPLTEKLKAFQYKIYERIYPLVQDKMEGLKEVTVPLDKCLWPSKPKVKEKSDQDVVNESEDRVEEDEGDNDSGETILEREDSESEIKRNCETMDEISADVKDNLEKAVDMGDKLQYKLEESNKKALKVAQRVSLDVESYYAENMDDLFNDEDEEKESEADDQMSASGQDITVLKDRTSSSEDQGDKNEGNGGLLMERSESAHSMEDPEEIERLKSEAYWRHMKGISEDVHCYLDKLQELFICVYEQLKTPEGRDCCYSQLEEPFFKPIWQYLLALYRYGNKSSEIKIAHVMTVHWNCMPAELGVKEKLRLESHDQNLHDIPYKPAIEELGTISSKVTLLGKLESLVKSSRLICRCVEEHYSSAGKIPSIGADDLLPILGYVIIRTGLPQILSECSILEEFIHEGYIMGEEGYCLTSVQTALQYLRSLSDKLLTSDEE